MSLDIVKLLSELGFPIVMCIVLFKQNDKLTNIIMDFQEVLTEIKTLLKNKEDDNNG